MAEVVKFPSWRYHRTERAVIVASQIEAEALGPGWTDSQESADAYVPVEAPVEVPVLEDGEDEDVKKKPRKGGR